WYFLVQGLCAFITAWTALAWARENPGVKSHRWRFRLLLLALVTVLIGWPLEQQVAELRAPRNQATDTYLGAPPEATALENMNAARTAFGRRHVLSLLLNFATLLLVSGAMALASQLPPGAPSETH